MIQAINCQPLRGKVYFKSNPVVKAAEEVSEPIMAQVGYFMVGAGALSLLGLLGYSIFNSKGKRRTHGISSSNSSNGS